MVVGEHTVEGVTVEIKLESELFAATVHGERITSKTMTGIKTLIAGAIRAGGALDVEVSMLETDGDDLRRPVDHTKARIVGMHARTNRLTVEYEHGLRDSLGHYSNLYRRLSSAELKEISAMVVERIKIERRISDWKEARTVNGAELVKKAREKQGVKSGEENREAGARC